MIDWLMLQTFAISLIVLFLLMIKGIALRFLGAQGIYKLWLLVPLSFAMSMLPQWSESDSQLVSYMVSVKRASAEMAQPFFELSDGLLVLWLSGVLALVIALFMAHRRYVRSLNEFVDPHTLLREIDGLKGTRVYTSETLVSPCIVGWLNPSLVIPKDFLRRFNTAQQQLILRHELAHKQRGDLICNLFAQCVLILFWFNPLIWKGYQVFRQTQELACDQTVLATSNKSTRIDYAKAMLLCTQQESRVFSTSLHYGGKSDMQERLTHIKQVKASYTWRWLAVGFSLFMALGLFHSVSAGSANGVTKVHPISRVEPLYPVEAAQQGIEGSVVLSFDIDIEGQVENVIVVDANPKKTFDKAAKIALRQWLYTKPDRRLEEVMVQLDFVLDKTSEAPGLEVKK